MIFGFLGEKLILDQLHYKHKKPSFAFKFFFVKFLYKHKSKFATKKGILPQNSGQVLFKNAALLQLPPSKIPSFVFCLFYMLLRLNA